MVRRRADGRVLFLAGLEIKREVLEENLSERERLLVPVCGLDPATQTFSQFRIGEFGSAGQATPMESVSQ